MAKLQRYTQISHGSGEDGHDYSFVNLAYNEDNESTDDIEREWTLEGKGINETKFKPRKRRCTKVNVAVALFILAAGGLAVFLIVKLSQDHQKVYTTPQPGPLEGSTKIPSSTSIPPLISSTTMMSSTSTTAPASTSSPPITSPITSTLSTPSTTQTPMTSPSTISTTSTSMTTPSSTSTTSSTTTSTSQPSTTTSTATTAQPISTTKPMTTTTLSTVTTAASQISTNSSIGTTTSTLTTASGTNTTSQSLMSTTSLSEKSTASTTTIISSSTTASTMTTTTTPMPTAISNVVSTTQEVTTHTTANGTNNTEGAGMMFDASMTVTSVTWDENYRNSTSDAYRDLVSNFTSQVEDGIKNSEVGSSFSHVTITSVSPGSVVFDFRIHMMSSSYPSGGSQATITNSVVHEVLVKVVQNAKGNGTQTLLSGINDTTIAVNTVIETTRMPSTTKISTFLPTATSLNASLSTLPQTTATTPRMTTTTMSTTISPCTNSTYLSTTLLSYCIEPSKLNEVVNASEDVKCKYILSAVDCVLEKIRIDFKINCTDEHKIAALGEFSGTVQVYLGIDPKICDLPITMSTTTSSDAMTTTKPTMTTTVSTTTNPCTNSTYLSSSLLSNCINSSQLSEVATLSDDVKCNFILSAVDCVLEKIRLDFGVNCTDEHKLAALEEFSGTVQIYLGIDPKICSLPITMSTTKTPSSGERSPYTSTTPLTTNNNSTTTIHITTTTPRTKQQTTITTILSSTTTQLTTTHSSTTKQQPTTTTQSSTTATQSAATTSLTTRTEPTAINPCMNSTYLSSILSQSSCIADSNKLAEVKNASDEVKCNYISSIVDCVLEGVRSGINITCTNKQKIIGLYEIEELALAYLTIDPKTCDLSANISTNPTSSARTTLSGATTLTTKTTSPVTTTMTTATNNLTATTTPMTTTTTTPMTTTTTTLMTTMTTTTTPMTTKNVFTTKTPLMTTKTTPVTTTMTTTMTKSTKPMTTTINPCTNSTYLSSTLLSQCLDFNQLAAVTSASDGVKCNFILSAIDCVLEKIRLDFGITCTADHRVAALDEFSGTVQTYLGVDPKAC